MHILAALLAWPPTAIGGPIASAELLRELHRRGHKITVISQTEDRRKLELDDHGIPHRMDDGIKVTSMRGWRSAIARRFIDVDVVYTHPDLLNTQMTRPVGWDMARAINAPLVYALHNMKRTTHISSRQWPAAMYIWNSESTRRYSEISVDVSGVVAFPLLHVQDHYVSDRSNATAVTLVNVSNEKGARVFFSLAERLPNVSFIAVRGGYNAQLVSALPNVTTVGPFKRELLPEMVWSKTRVLLMPSKIEAWGMSALEAACSGIPTIACPAAGLVEALDWAGTFVDESDLDRWEVELTSLLDDQERYALRSADAYVRAMEVERLSSRAVDDVERAMSTMLGTSAPSKNDVAQRSWSSRLPTMMAASDAAKLTL